MSSASRATGCSSTSTQETFEEAQTIFDKQQARGSCSARHRSRRTSSARSAPGAAGGYGAGRSRTAASTSVVRQAAHDREEITRLVLSLPEERPEPGGRRRPRRRRRSSSASRRSPPIRSRTDGGIAPGASEELERQIAKLESEANPLDVAASENRVRRLALLKRERRALADAISRRDESAAKLESCRLQLQNMRLDILRLRAGGVAEAAVHITQLTHRARALADDVDAAILGVDEARLAAVSSTASRRGPRRT